jgi:hypothetical protein
MNRRATQALAVLVLLLAPSCATTVVESPTASGSDDEPATTAPLPADPAERLRELLALVTGLGARIVEGDDRPAVERIEALWAASRTEVADRAPDVAREVEHQFEILRLGVARNRPADADKASRNLSAVLEGYLDRTGA